MSSFDVSVLLSEAVLVHFASALIVIEMKIRCSIVYGVLKLMILRKERLLYFGAA